jgi:hypothetical protein
MSRTSNDFDRNEPGFDTLHRVADGLYSFLTEFKFDGKFPIHNRSYVVHVPHLGSLAIINPAELSTKTAAAIHALEAELGAQVRYLISPGDWHYMFIDQHVKAFPEASAFVPPGRIPSKQPSFPFTLIPIDGSPVLPELAPTLTMHVVQGLRDVMDPEGKRPRYELVFHLPAIRAISSGDVFYYIGREPLSQIQQMLGQRALAVAFHFHGWKMIASGEALQRSLAHILTWDFDRFLSVHGDPGNLAERGVHADVAKILAWVEQGPPVPQG